MPHALIPVLCLVACQAFVARCPKEVGAFHDRVGEAALAYLSYDPNYAADGDEEMEEADDIEDEEDEDAGNYSDDDDVSWKGAHPPLRKRG